MARALRWLLLSLLLLLVCSCAQSFLKRWTRGDPSSTAKHHRSLWFKQKLNHFSKNRSQFWLQRYFLNDAFYKPGGPVFLITSGEGAATGIAASRNITWMTYAERLGALFLILEHRFYGESQPTGDLSTASLHYLSSRQALADIVNFRTEIARKLGLTENKWVTFGGSYGGSLAVWSRIKHPNLFAAAVSSSAPIQAKLNFYEFNEVIGRILSAHNSECPKAVKEAFAILVQMLKRRKYYSKVKKDFRLCEPIKIHSPRETAFLMENMIHLVQSFVHKQVNKVIKRQWFYQCCTAFGFFKTTDSKNKPFSGTPLRHGFHLCSDVFGPEFSSDLVAQSVKTTNKYYGGFNVNGSKIIFSNGSNDPWHHLGITMDISKDLPSVFIKGFQVIAELIQAREKIFQILQKWLKQ